MPFLTVWYPCVLLLMILFLITHQRIPLFAWARNVFPTCTVLAGHRYGFEREFRIELMGDWLKCQKSPYLLFFWSQVKWNSISHHKDLNKKVLSLTNWWNYTVLKRRLKQFDTNIKTIKLLFHNLLFFRKYATNNDVAIQTVNNIKMLFHCLKQWTYQFLFHF